jgi:hypothetical protein
MLLLSVGVELQTDEFQRKMNVSLRNGKGGEW